LNGQSVGAEQPSNDLSQECQTGADANARDDCRIIGYVNSVQAYWGQAVEGYQLAPTTFFTEGVNTGCGYATSAVGPFYCPPTAASTSTSASSTSCRAASGRRAGPSPRRMSSPTSTATTSRT